MAAGQGFKTFTTGEVLSASDVNGYLMQGVLVFASAAARDAAITSPQEGQFAYLKDTNVTTYYTGSAWSNLDTTGMTNPMTTTGDTIYSSSGSTPARLGIGSTGQVLTVAGGVPTWAAASAGGKSYSLINSGGTALTGAATITISSISNYDDLVIMVLGASSVDASSNVFIRLNADATNNYRFGGPMIIGGAAYDSNNFTTELGNPTSLMRLFRISASATGTGSGTARVSGCNTTGFKAFTVSGAGANDSSNSQRSYWYNGMYLGTSTISSVDIVSGTGNFDAGTVYIYGAA